MVFLPKHALVGSLPAVMAYDTRMEILGFGTKTVVSGTNMKPSGSEPKLQEGRYYKLTEQFHTKDRNYQMEKGAQFKFDGSKLEFSFYRRNLHVSLRPFKVLKKGSIQNEPEYKTKTKLFQQETGMQYEPGCEECYNLQKAAKATSYSGRIVCDKHVMLALEEQCDSLGLRKEADSILNSKSLIEKIESLEGLIQFQKEILDLQQQCVGYETQAAKIVDRQDLKQTEKIDHLKDLLHKARMNKMERLHEQAMKKIDEKIASLEKFYDRSPALATAQKVSAANIRFICNISWKDIEEIYKKLHSSWVHLNTIRKANGMMIRKDFYVSIEADKENSLQKRVINGHIVCGKRHTGNSESWPQQCPECRKGMFVYLRTIWERELSLVCPRFRYAISDYMNDVESTRSFMKSLKIKEGLYGELQALEKNIASLEKKMRNLNREILKFKYLEPKYPSFKHIDTTLYRPFREIYRTLTDGLYDSINTFDQFEWLINSGLKKVVPRFQTSIKTVIGNAQDVSGFIEQANRKLNICMTKKQVEHLKKELPKLKLLERQIAELGDLKSWKNTASVVDEKKRKLQQANNKLDQLHLERLGYKLI